MATRLSPSSAPKSKPVQNVQATAKRPTGAKPPKSVKLPWWPIGQSAVSANGEHVFASDKGSRGRLVRIDLTNGKTVDLVAGPEFVSSMAAANDGRLAIAFRLPAGGCVLQIRATDGATTRSVELADVDWPNLSWAPQQDLVLVVSNQKIMLLDPASGKLTEVKTGPIQSASAAFAKDGSLVALLTTPAGDDVRVEWVGISRTGVVQTRGTPDFDYSSGSLTPVDAGFVFLDSNSDRPWRLLDEKGKTRVSQTFFTHCVSADGDGFVLGGRKKLTRFDAKGTPRGSLSVKEDVTSVAVAGERILSFGSKQVEILPIA